MADNLFKKIQDIRVELRNCNLTMTGKNTFAGYDYFELEDFLPQLELLMQKYRMTAIPSFTKDLATLTVCDFDSDNTIVITSPFGSAALKGCHEVQSIGAVETYQRRYLYQALFDIGEKDCLNATQGKDEQEVKPSDKTAQKPDYKPTAQSVGMSLEEAKKVCFASGNSANVPFGDLKDTQLKWIAENSKGKYQQAAQIILRSRAKQQSFLNGLQEDNSDDDIPF